MFARDLADARRWGAATGLFCQSISTNEQARDTDEDTLGNCREVADGDGNGAVTISDVVFAARAALVLSPPTMSGDMDIDKNTAVTISDVVATARFALLSGLCK